VDSGAGTNLVLRNWVGRLITGRARACGGPFRKTGLGKDSGAVRLVGGPRTRRGTLSSFGRAVLEKVVRGGTPCRMPSKKTKKKRGSFPVWGKV